MSCALLQKFHLKATICFSSLVVSLSVFHPLQPYQLYQLKSEFQVQHFFVLAHFKHYSLVVVGVVVVVAVGVVVVVVPVVVVPVARLPQAPLPALAALRRRG